MSKPIPNPEQILLAWIPFKALIGVTIIKTQEDYDHVHAIMESLLDVVGDDESHPLADVTDYIGNIVKSWEDENC